jgi:HTH-type transcriptional regulator / antitoxin HigA
MIGNDRQYRITKKRLGELEKALAQSDVRSIAERVGSVALAQVERDALQSEVEVLTQEIHEYEELKAGRITTLEVSRLEDLPRMLIRARIAKGLTQLKLAEQMGLKEQQIQRYEAEEYASASYRRLMEFAKALDLQITSPGKLSVASAPRIPPSSQELDWAQFPLREMYKRKWFEGYNGSLQEALQDAQELVREYVTGALGKPAYALHRKRVRSRSTLDEYALLAWECRIISLSRKEPISAEYNPASLEAKWFTSLVQLSRWPDGPVRAKAFLAESGIALVVEPQLPKTALDGAVLLEAGKPAIGLTLRYDRIDNFWFVLFHELAHLTQHQQQLWKGTIEGFFDDLEEPDPDQLELEADTFAGEMLISKVIWERALARYTRSRESVLSLADRLEIDPAIIAGRIRYETKNFTLLNELVGQGKVRSQFPMAVSVA